MKRVPYWIVPDAWAKDPAFVDRVIEGMKLATPNMVLNFNPVLQPITRYVVTRNSCVRALLYVLDSAYLASDI